VQSQTQRKELTDKQRRLWMQHAELQQAISERGLTHEEAIEYRRLKAKIASAEEEHQRKRLIVRGERRR
jgi:hypothetical protein